MFLEMPLTEFLHDDLAYDRKPNFEVKLGEFVRSHAEKGHKIVMITSGGTSIRIEKSAVRTIENFSTGRRGAKLAE